MADIWERAKPTDLSTFGAGTYRPPEPPEEDPNKIWAKAAPTDLRMMTSAGAAQADPFWAEYRASRYAESYQVMKSMAEVQYKDRPEKQQEEMQKIQLSFYIGDRLNVPAEDVYGGWDSQGRNPYAETYFKSTEMPATYAGYMKNEAERAFRLYAATNQASEMMLGPFNREKLDALQATLDKIPPEMVTRDQGALWNFVKRVPARALAQAPYLLDMGLAELVVGTVGAGIGGLAAGPAGAAKGFLWGRRLGGLAEGTRLDAAQIFMDAMTYPDPNTGKPLYQVVRDPEELWALAQKTGLAGGVLTGVASGIAFESMIGRLPQLMQDMGLGAIRRAGEQGVFRGFIGQMLQKYGKNLGTQMTMMDLEILVQQVAANAIAAEGEIVGPPTAPAQPSPIEQVKAFTVKDYARLALQGLPGAFETSLLIALPGSIGEARRGVRGLLAQEQTAAVKARLGKLEEMSDTARPLQQRAVEIDTRLEELRKEQEKLGPELEAITEAADIGRDLQKKIETHRNNQIEIQYLESLKQDAEARAPDQPWQRTRGEQETVEVARQRAAEAETGRMPGRPEIVAAKGLRSTAEGTPGAILREQDIVNPIPRDVSTSEKVRALKVLSDENKPILDAGLAAIKGQLGLEGKSSYKLPERIIEKATRPIILAERPWHDVEHIRDALRFKVISNTLEDFGNSLRLMLEKTGAQVVELDTAKMFEPKEWGWRFAGADLRMPNGQLVEFYTPLAEVEAAKKAGNHALFEKWRNKDVAEIMRDPDQREAYNADLIKSNQDYEAAFEKAMRRLGTDRNAALASWKSLTAALAGLELSPTREKLSLSSSAEGMPTSQPASSLTSEKARQEAQTRPRALSSETIQGVKSAIPSSTSMLTHVEQLIQSENDLSPASPVVATLRRGLPNLTVPQAQGAALYAKLLASHIGESLGQYIGKRFIEGVFSPEKTAELEAAGHRGAIAWTSAGKRIFYTTTRSDFVTWVHELTHQFETDLTPTERGTVERWLGITGAWSEKNKETFAQTAVAYMAKGLAPNQELAPVFARFTRWVNQVYEGASVEWQISPDIIELYNKALSGQVHAPTESIPGDVNVLFETRPGEGPELRDPADLTIDNVLRSSDFHAAWKRFYYDENGNQVVSSRLQPAELSSLRLQEGTWMVDDQFKGIHGHEIAQLRWLDPYKLELQEPDYTKEPNYEGRGDDARRYAGWMKEGKIPPPIMVLETEAGTLRVTDGHRRTAAAKWAEQKVLAWVYPIAEHPGGLTEGATGRVQQTGFTYEMATGRSWETDQASEGVVRPRMETVEIQPAKPSEEALRAEMERFREEETAQRAQTIFERADKERPRFDVQEGTDESGQPIYYLTRNGEKIEWYDSRQEADQAGARLETDATQDLQERSYEVARQGFERSWAEEAQRERAQAAFPAPEGPTQKILYEPSPHEESVHQAVEKQMPVPYKVLREYGDREWARAELDVRDYLTSAARQVETFEEFFDWQAKSHQGTVPNESYYRLIWDRSRETAAPSELADQHFKDAMDGDAVHHAIGSIFLAKGDVDQAAIEALSPEMFSYGTKILDGVRDPELEAQVKAQIDAEPARWRRILGDAMPDDLKQELKLSLDAADLPDFVPVIPKVANERFTRWLNDPKQMVHFLLTVGSDELGGKNKTLARLAGRVETELDYDIAGSRHWQALKEVRKNITLYRELYAVATGDEVMMRQLQAELERAPETEETRLLTENTRLRREVASQLEQMKLAARESQVTIADLNRHVRTLSEKQAGYEAEIVDGRQRLKERMREAKEEQKKKIIITDVIRRQLDKKRIEELQERANEERAALKAKIRQVRDVGKQKLIAERQMRQVEKWAEYINRPVNAGIADLEARQIEDIQSRIEYDPADVNESLKNRLREWRRQHPTAPLPPALVQMIEARSPKLITAAEMRQLYDQVKILRTKGRKNRMAALLGERQYMDSQIKEVTTSIMGGQKPKDLAGLGTRGAQRQVRTPGIKKMMWATWRMNRIAEIMDHRAGGPATRWLWDTINENTDETIRRVDAYTNVNEEKLRELALTARTFGRQENIDGLKMTRAEMIGVYIYSQFEDSLFALQEDNRIAQSSIANIIKALSPEEKKYGDWMIETLSSDADFDRLQAVQLSVSNQRMDRLPRYFPIQRQGMSGNPLLSELARELLDMAGKTSKPRPRQGFLRSRMERTPGVSFPPMRLDGPAVFMDHIAKREFYIANAMTIKRMTRIFDSREVKAAMLDRFGDAMEPLVQKYIAQYTNPNIYRAFEDYGEFARILRSNVGLSLLGHNVLTILRQIPDIPQIMMMAGPVDGIRAAAEFLTNPRKAIQEVWEKAPQLKRRSYDRFIEEMKLLDRNAYERVVRGAGETGFAVLKAMDTVTNVIGWKAMYNKTLRRTGNETVALNTARDFILRKRPAARAKDLAAIYRSPGLSWFLMFSNQTNQQWNILTFDIPQKIAAGFRGEPGALIDAIMNVTGLLIGAVGMGLIARKGVMTKEGMLQDFMNLLLGNTPFIGNAFEAAIRGEPSRDALNPFGGAYQIGKLMYDIADQAETEKVMRDLQNALFSLGGTLGLPVVQARRIYKTIDTGDPWELVGGPPKEKK